MPVYKTSTAEETAKLGARLAKRLEGGEVVCLSGSLGSGKTTFVTGLVGHFLSQTRVLSPTFTLIRQYEIHHKKIQYIYHLDLYRLNRNAQTANLGFGEYIQRSDTVVLVEWPEKLKLNKPYGRGIDQTIGGLREGGSKEVPQNKRIEISFSIVDDTKRVITLRSLHNHRAL